MKVTFVSIITVWKSLKEFGRIKNQRKNQNHLDDRITKICHNTERILRRLAAPDHGMIQDRLKGLLI